MFDQAENDPPWYDQEGSMKAYTLSTKPSWSAREKRENKILSLFWLNK